MTNEEMWERAEAALRDDLLISNLDATAVGPRSRELVETASARGTLCFLDDGTFALAVDERVVGSPANRSSRERTVHDVLASRDSVVVVFGYGVGHTARDLRQETDAPIVVFDPDPSLLRAAFELGPVDSEKVTVVCDIDELRHRWPQMTMGRAAATLVVTPGYAEAYPEELARLTEVLGTMLSSAQVSETTLRLRSAGWVRNLFENLERLPGLVPFGRLRDAYAGVPAFIVGAGPSLSRNRHLLPDATRKGIVFALNSSASVLAQQGAEPQLLVCLEAANHSGQLRDLPWRDRVNVALSLSASPATWAAAPGPIMPIYEAIPPFLQLRSLLHTDPVSVAGSVTTAAFSMAVLLGCSPIVLLGQDLAFTNGRVHAEGTEIEHSRVFVDREAQCIHYDWCAPAQRILSEVTGPPATERLTEVPAWGGDGTVVTSATWNLVREWLESQAELLDRARPDLTLINATEGGSRVPLFTELPLSDVLDALPPIDITAADMRARALTSGPPISSQQVEAWALDQASRAAEAATSALAVRVAVDEAMSALGSSRPQDVARAFENLRSAETELSRSAANQPLLDAWCHAPIDVAVDGVGGTNGGREAASRARAALAAEATIADVLHAGATEMDRVLRSIARKE